MSFIGVSSQNDVVNVDTKMGIEPIFDQNFKNLSLIAAWGCGDPMTKSGRGIF